MTIAYEKTDPVYCRLSLKSIDYNLFCGYASVFDVEDTQKEVIVPGAFYDTLAEHRLQRTMPRMLYEHQSNHEIGEWQKVEEDSHGLWVEGQLHSTSFLPLLSPYHCKDSFPIGLSIGFMSMRTSYTKGVRYLHKLKLFEISLVSLPANPLAIMGRSINS